MYTLINMDNMNTTFSSLKTPITKVSTAFIIIVSVCIIPLFFHLFYNKEKYVKIFRKKFLIYPFYVKRWSLFLLSISFIAIIFSLSVFDVLSFNFKVIVFL